MVSRRGRGFALGMSAAVAGSSGRRVRDARSDDPAGRQAERPAAAPARTFASLAEAEAPLRRSRTPARSIRASLEAAAGLRIPPCVPARRSGSDGSATPGAALCGPLLQDVGPLVRACCGLRCRALRGPDDDRGPDRRSSTPTSGGASAAAKAVGLLARPKGGEAPRRGHSRRALARAPRPRCCRRSGGWPTRRPQRRAAGYAADPDPEGPRRRDLRPRAQAAAGARLAVLTAALSDGDPDTAAIAARGLGVLGKKESLAPLAAA